MPGKGDGIEIALTAADWDQPAAIPWTVRGFGYEPTERMTPRLSSILVSPINQDTMT
jgi:hypothetical protein